MKAMKMKFGRLSLLAALSLSSASALGTPLFDPAQQPYGTIPPVSITGFNLATGTQKAFQAWFDDNTWAGDVVAYPVGTNGKTDVTTRLWSAAVVFAGKQACYATEPAPASVSYFDTGRRIVTRNGATNVAFRWASLSASQQASIGDATNGPKILDFVRGDRSNEKYLQVLAGDDTVQTECGVQSPGTGLFRARTNILGDIIHSRSVYVSAPPADFAFDGYQTFKANNAARAPRLYVGANDGMVHVFDTATGDEVWAYIPSMLVDKLKKLSVDPYTHTYFLDAGMTVGDVNFGTTAAPDWRTVLVGGLGAGGKGLFALDVTSPSASDETSAAAKILWEITPASAGFAELGDTYGDLVIARLNSGQWAVIAGNGYNNTASGKAVLYVIDIKTGALIKALDTGSGSAASPNGLSTPVAVDLTFDGKVDRVYAGDIDGNLWKFNISAVDSSTWVAPTSPLFAAGQAIIGAPDVTAHPLTGYLVTFATGRMFTNADATDTTVQNYAYGIWDGAPPANTAILGQTLTEALYGTQRVRATSGLSINWDDASDPVAKPLHKGWRTALPLSERVLGTGFVRDARYQFTSVNPTIVNTPPPDGENWLVELDYLTGGVADKLVFDLNSDGLLTAADRVTDGGGNPIAGPTGIPVAIYQGPGLLSQPLLAILSPLLSTTLFNQNPFFGSAESPDNPVPPISFGVEGGHFDVDFYHPPLTAPPASITATYHLHEYDDIFDVTGVNMLNASEPLFNISNAIADVNTPFKILISNQRLSPAVSFSYGGLPYQNVTTLLTSAGMTMASLPTFTRATITTLKFHMPTDAFTPKDWAGTGDVRAGLHPTQTPCVRAGLPLSAKNQIQRWPANKNGQPGPAGEFRNGALVFQLVKDTTPQSAIRESQPGDPRYGYRLKDLEDDPTSYDYHLAEWSVFWHHKQNYISGVCMGDPLWTPTPPADNAPFKGVQITPAAGSADPPRDEFGTVTSTTVVTVPDPSGSPSQTIRTTTTFYSSGAQLIVTEWLTGSSVTKTTITMVPPPMGGSGGGGSGGPSQALSAPNTVTGYQQTRSSGKLGRINWHEMFAQ